MKQTKIDLNGKTALGYEIPLQNAVLVFVAAEKGFVMCGYLNIETAEKLGDAACVVRGVKTASGLLEAKIEALTSKAKLFGIEIGMTGREALERLY